MNASLARSLKPLDNLRRVVVTAAMDALERFRFVAPASATPSSRLKKSPPPAKKKARVAFLRNCEADIEEIAVLASSAGQSGVAIMLTDGVTGDMPTLQGATTSAGCDEVVPGDEGSSGTKLGTELEQSGTKARRMPFKWGTAAAQPPERWKQVLDGIR